MPNNRTVTEQTLVYFCDEKLLINQEQSTDTGNNLGDSFSHLLGFWAEFFFLIYLFSFLAVLGLRCCTWAFSSCGEWGLLFIAVHRLLTVVASLVAEHGL